MLLRNCERAFPLALPIWGGSTPPNPLQMMLDARSNHRRVLIVCQNMQSLLLAPIYAISMRARHWHTHASNRGTQGQRPGPGVQGAGYPLGAVPLPPAAQANCICIADGAEELMALKSRWR